MAGETDSAHIRDLEKLLPYHRREWAFQRAGWAVLTLFLIAAALGLLGPGGLSRSRAEDGPLRIEYDRIGRHEADLNYALACPAPAYRHMRVTLSPGCLRESRLEWMRPEPDSSLAGDEGGLAYVFPLEAGIREVRIEWALKPRTTGRRRCRIAVEGVGAASIAQYVLP